MDEKQPDSPDTISFETAIRRLEDIVRQLEDGELGLNQSLERYEEGVKLLRQSYELLQNAERKIELLSGVDADGNPIAQPFDHSATIEQPDATKRRGRRRTTAANSEDCVDEP
jgi:exodeoxyribonuclease VII small subunit